MSGKIRTLLKSAVSLAVATGVIASLSLTSFAASTLSFTFADDTHDGMFVMTNEEIASLERVSDFGHNGAGSLKVTHVEGRGYVSTDYAVCLTFDEALPKDKYTISAWFYVPSEGNEGKGTLTGPGIVFNGDTSMDENKFPSSPGTINLDEWKQVNVTATPIKEVETLLFRFVVNDAPNVGDVWYLSDITISSETADITGAAAGAVAGAATETPAAEEETAATETPAATTAAAATTTTTPAKGSPNTGVEGVAAITAVSIIAGGAIVLSRKKK